MDENDETILVLSSQCKRHLKPSVPSFLGPQYLPQGRKDPCRATRKQSLVAQILKSLKTRRTLHKREAIHKILLIDINVCFA